MHSFAGLLFASLAWNITAVCLADERPGPIDTAIAAAEPYLALKLSFSMQASAPNSGSVVLRYDANTDDWSVLEGELESFDRKTRNAIEERKAEITKPGGLTYATKLDVLHFTGLVSETGTALIYEIDVDKTARQMPEAMQRVMEWHLHISRESGHITDLSFRATEPFKPVPVAIINTLIVQQEYSSLPGLDTAILTRYSNTVSGRTFFMPFNEDLTLELFDFEFLSP